MTPPEMPALSQLRGVASRFDRLVATGVIEGGVLGTTGLAGEKWIHPAGTGKVGEGPQAMRRDHQFLLTSISKALTATQVLILAQAGAIDLDSPVAAYLPEFAVGGKGAVTIAQLLAHTSGLDNGANLVEGPTVDYTAETYIEIALRAGLAFRPGTQWAYCSPGYWVLGELISRISGHHYTDHLVTTIATPLAMQNTRYDSGSELPSKYVRANHPEPQNPEQVRRSAYPAGGIIGTAGDLLSFGRSFLDGAEVPLLQSATRQLLAREFGRGYLLGRDVRWTLGWELGGPGTLRSERTLFHAGASGTGLWVDRENQVVVVLLTATWWLDWRYFGELVNGVIAAMTTEKGGG